VLAISPCAGYGYAPAYYGGYTTRYAPAYYGPRRVIRRAYAYGGLATIGGIAIAGDRRSR